MPLHIQYQIKHNFAFFHSATWELFTCLLAELATCQIALRTGDCLSEVRMNSFVNRVIFCGCDSSMLYSEHNNIAINIFARKMREMRMIENLRYPLRKLAKLPFPEGDQMECAERQYQTISTMRVSIVAQKRNLIMGLSKCSNSHKLVMSKKRKV